MERGVRVSGQIVDGGGIPVAHARVSAVEGVAASGSGFAGFSGCQEGTDDSGEFAVRAVPGRHRIVARTLTGGHATAWIDVPAAGLRGVVLRVAPPDAAPPEDRDGPR